MTRILIDVAVMAGITYLIRVLPISLFKKEVTSAFVRSFLYYVPYAVLAALTFPSVFHATGSEITSVAGTVAALILAYYERGLVLAAVGAVLAALLFSVSFF